MKSKYNPFLFRPLATAALCALAPIHAATIDTTGTTIVLNASNPENTYIGNGTLEVSGGGISLDTDSSHAITEFAMTGGLINIVSGTSLVNGGWQKGVWTNNRAGMQVDGSFDLNDGNPVIIDALTGSGTVTKYYWNPELIRHPDAYHRPEWRLRHLQRHHHPSKCHPYHRPHQERRRHPDSHGSE